MTQHGDDAIKDCFVATTRTATVDADRCALIHECCEGHIPAIVHIAKAMIVAHTDLVEEHFVESGAAVHLFEWANLDVRVMHVDDEAGEPLVLRQ